MGLAFLRIVTAIALACWVSGCREPATNAAEILTRGVDPGCGSTDGGVAPPDVDTYVVELYRAPASGVGGLCDACTDCERVAVACRCGPPRAPDTRTLRLALSGLELGPFVDDPPGRYCVRLRGLRTRAGPGPAMEECACEPAWLDPEASPSAILCGRSRTTGLVPGGTVVIEPLVCGSSADFEACRMPIGAEEP